MLSELVALPSLPHTVAGMSDQCSEAIGESALAVLLKVGTCDEMALRSAWDDVDRAGTTAEVRGLLGMCLVVAVSRYFASMGGDKIDLADRAAIRVLETMPPMRATHDFFAGLVLLGDGDKEFAQAIPPDLRGVLTSMLIPVLAEMAGLDLAEIVERAVFLMNE